MVDIYLIRHGQASFGLPDYDQLTPLGERQAELLGCYLSGSGLRFDAVYAGSLQRQMQTAAIVLAPVNGNTADDIIVDSDFNEFDDSDRIMSHLHGVFRENSALSEEMQQIRTHPHAIRRIFDVADKTRTEPSDDGQRIMQADQFRARIARGIDNLIANTAGDDQRVAVFTSGGPIAVTLRKTLEANRDQAIRLGWELCNTSITRFRHEQDRLALVQFNCLAHLESQNDPALITYI
ncbi:histidine phosphatase family protein [Desulfosarcina ovata subsp. sediminis]|uniref:Histidine phosphatase family protein n=1 Tax=Desulfosarcina ovata subsp. sediminis TaxID=885957 RepID=A0A5K7ZMH7_9BACT|nr:histidine phosphatase family protein [Desulfosarcina ovata]BBO81585.1 histidine phosphatase family protein [Desulfosarcina ovata subsp. sediminis]